MERYEVIEGSSSKFWQILVEGETLTVTFGRIGTDGQTKTKTFSGSAEAEAEKTRLVKEKVRKGYAAAGTADAPANPTSKPKPEPAPPVSEKPSPEPDVPQDTRSEPASEPVVADPDGSPELDDAMLLALPTRSRPSRHLLQGSWSVLANILRVVIEDWHGKAEHRASYRQYANDQLLAAEAAMERLSRSGANATPPEPETPLKPDDAVGWLLDMAIHLHDVALTVDHADGSKQSWQSQVLATLRFLEWVLDRQGAAFLGDLVATFTRDHASEVSSHQHHSWKSPLDLAMRHLLSGMSDDAYETVLAKLSMDVAPDGDWFRRASFAFMLADEREVAHDLMPLPVIEGAVASGVNPAEAYWLLPLIVEAAPDAASRFRSKRGPTIYSYYLHVEMEEILGTAIATARRAGQSPLATLDWLHAIAGHSTQVAGLMLSTGEVEAVGLLLPIVHQKEIRAAFDKASADRPARTFRQCIGALAAGRTDPVLKARVVDAIQRHPLPTLRAFVAADPRSLSCLDRLVEARDVPVAPPEALPAVLRDPPWRKKGAAKPQADALSLTPIETPFVWNRDKPPAEDDRWRHQNARVTQTVAELSAFIAEVEGKALPSWYNVPASSRALPRPTDDWETACSYVAHRILEIYRARSYGVHSAGWNKLYDIVEKQPEPLALTLWELGAPLTGTYYWPAIFDAMMVRFGERALPGLIRQLEASPVSILEGIRDVDAGAIAPYAARALVKLKKARLPAMAWLRRHRETAILRLIPAALGAPGPERDAAETTLRWFTADRTDGRSTIEALGERYATHEPAVRAALAGVLDGDGLERFPARVSKLPAWFDPTALTRPQLKDGGALSDDAMRALADMLAFSTPEAVYPGVAIVREATTPDSLAAFGWDTLSVWLAQGAPGKDNWALRALGWIGDDETARQLTRLIRKWPGEAAHARAVTGLDVLAEIGSDVALMNLNGIAEKLKFKGLQEKAREKIAALAEARDLTPEELADRLAPDLDLDERGGLDIDFGPRQFRVGFDELLKPWVKDASGQRLKDLPKPNKADDAERAGAAVKTWGALKKDARAIASLQIARLETMLSTARRVSPAVFWTFFASHPLIRHLTQRLVWGVYSDDAPASSPDLIFRVADDLSVTDGADDPVTLATGEDAPGRIGLVHPLQLPPGGLDGFGALFGDYEISQPFPQLGRETYTLTKDEAAATELRRFDGIMVDTGRVRGVPSRGWQLGAPQDGGCIFWIERPVVLPDKSRHTAMLSFEIGLFAGAADMEEKQQKLGTVQFDNVYGKPARQVTFGELDPLTASELLRSLSILAENGTT